MDPANAISTTAIGVKDGENKISLTTEDPTQDSVIEDKILIIDKPEGDSAIEDKKFVTSEDPIRASATEDGGNKKFVFTEESRRASAIEDGEDNMFKFTEKSVQKAFVKKVYGILTCQLVVTFGFIMVFAYALPRKDIKLWAIQRRWFVFLTMYPVMLVCLIAMTCCEKVRRKTPWNYIFLGMFTVAESVMLGFICIFKEPTLVLMAVGMTAVISLALTIFAFQTKLDFTPCGAILVCTLSVLLAFGISAIFINGRVLHFLYVSLGATLFSFFLVIDTQLMLEGLHKYSISPEDYIFAALTLYLDVINLFLFIYRIVTCKCD